MVCNKSIFYDFFLKSWRNIKCLLPLNSEWTSLGLFVWHFHLLGACSQCSGATFTLVRRPSLQVSGWHSNLVSKLGSSGILVQVYFWKEVGFLLAFVLPSNNHLCCNHHWVLHFMDCLLWIFPTNANESTSLWSNHDCVYNNCHIVQVNITFSWWKNSKI